MKGNDRLYGMKGDNTCLVGPILRACVHIDGLKKYIVFQSTSDSPPPGARKLEKFDFERNETRRLFSGADSAESFVKIWQEQIEADLSSGIFNPKKHSTQSKVTMIVV
uniref:Uncharacterized protein n=1 Tax=Amphimedon queenslandica TaxID=400682 RepID=A0A1X7VFS9_AMPQE